MADLESFRAGSKARVRSLIPSVVKEKNAKRMLERLITAAIVIVFFGTWEMLSRLGKISVVIFPAPSKIFVELILDTIHGVYTKNLLISMGRMFSGLLAGGSVGLIFGLFMGWSPSFRRILDPIVAALHPIPKMTLLPMALIIFGLGEASRVVMISISAFFPMLINTMVGVRQINPNYYEVMENYGANVIQTFQRVVLPGSLPYIMSGIRLSFQSALITTIGIEMIFGNTGLGSALWLSWETMKMWNLYGIIVIISIIGTGTTAIIELLKKYLLPWHHENRAI